MGVGKVRKGELLRKIKIGISKLRPTCAGLEALPEIQGSIEGRLCDCLKRGAAEIAA
jgi:hypothetical protein